MSLVIPKQRNIIFFDNIFIDANKALELAPLFKLHNLNVPTHLMETENVIVEPALEQMNSEFRSLSTWPKSSTLLCNMCSLPIGLSQPIPLASYIVYDEVTDEEVYKNILSYHHSWTCASRYNMVYNDNNETIYTSLKCLYKKWNKLEMLVDIPSGLPHTQMTQYGGKLSVFDWNLFNAKLLSNATKKRSL